MAQSYRLGFVTWSYQVRIPTGPVFIIVVVHNYTVLQTVQMHEVYSAVYATVHYKKNLEVIRNKSMAYSWLRASVCRDIAIIVQIAT